LLKDKDNSTYAFSIIPISCTSEKNSGDTELLKCIKNNEIPDLYGPCEFGEIRPGSRFPVIQLIANHSRYCENEGTYDKYKDTFISDEFIDCRICTEDWENWVKIRADPCR